MNIEFQSRRTADGAVRQASRTSVGIKFQCRRIADGAVRHAGKALGMMEAAREEIYFRKLQSHQISRMREQLDDVVDYLQRRIQELPEAIATQEEDPKVLAPGEGYDGVTGLSAYSSAPALGVSVSLLKQPELHHYYTVIIVCLCNSSLYHAL